MNAETQATESIIQELRRGTIIISVLSQLKTPQYGYSLVQNLDKKGFEIDPGTLYPLLRRLEKQNILISEWETTGSKPRKYYALSKSGEKIYSVLCYEWKKISENMDNLIREEK